MPSFQCPHCGNTTEIDESYAGRSGACVSCARPILVPDDIPDPNVKAPKMAKWSGPAILVASLLLVGFMAIAISKWVAAPIVQRSVQTARANRARSQAQQIVAAFYAYEADKGHLPPAYSVDENGKPLHSWRTLILPYMGSDASATYDQIRLDEPWDSPYNSNFSQFQLYRTAGDQGFAAGDTSFCVVAGPNFAFHKSTPRTYDDLKDDLVTMLMVIEVRSSNINWMEPRDVELPQLLQGINAGGQAICGSYREPGSAACGFADGVGRIVSETTSPETLAEMATIDGGESPEPIIDR